MRQLGAPTSLYMSSFCQGHDVCPALRSPGARATPKPCSGDRPMMTSLAKNQTTGERLRRQTTPIGRLEEGAPVSQAPDTGETQPIPTETVLQGRRDRYLGKTSVRDNVPEATEGRHVLRRPVDRSARPTAGNCTQEHHTILARYEAKGGIFHAVVSTAAPLPTGCRADLASRVSRNFRRTGQRSAANSECSERNSIHASCDRVWSGF